MISKNVKRVKCLDFREPPEVIINLLPFVGMRKKERSLTKLRKKERSSKIVSEGRFWLSLNRILPVYRRQYPPWVVDLLDMQPLQPHCRLSSKHSCC